MLFNIVDLSILLLSISGLYAFPAVPAASSLEASTATGNQMPKSDASSKNVDGNQNEKDDMTEDNRPNTILSEVIKSFDSTKVNAHNPTLKSSLKKSTKTQRK